MGRCPAETRQDKRETSYWYRPGFRFRFRFRVRVPGDQGFRGSRFTKSDRRNAECRMQRMFYLATLEAEVEGARVWQLPITQYPIPTPGMLGR